MNADTSSDISRTIPVVLSTWEFSRAANVEAARLLCSGASSLDAVQMGIRICEDDPSADTVGYGGVPNAEGVVELDAALMYGPGKRVGAVAGLRDIAEAITAARIVMDHTPHALIVGDEARKLALKHGLKNSQLLTDGARKQWIEWRKGRDVDRGHDTIGMAALDAAGNVCAGTSTSGVKFKQPGRVGDSPLVGSGLYADNQAGAAVATGVGEHILRYCMSFRVVEEMRSGKTPEEACKSTVEWAIEDSPDIDIGMVAIIGLSRDGSWACYSSKPGFVVYASVGEELELIESPHHLP